MNFGLCHCESTLKTHFHFLVFWLIKSLSKLGNSGSQADRNSGGWVMQLSHWWPLIWKRSWNTVVTESHWWQLVLFLFVGMDSQFTHLHHQGARHLSCSPVSAGVSVQSCSSFLNPWTQKCPLLSTVNKTWLWCQNCSFFLVWLVFLFFLKPADTNSWSLHCR